MATERDELLEWLGDDHQLTGEQVDELARIADEIAERYPEQDGEREAALRVAYRLMVEDPEDVAAELADDLLRARQAQSQAMAAVQQAATMLIDTNAKRGTRGIGTQGGFASFMGVDRMTVRQWLGLR